MSRFLKAAATALALVGSTALAHSEGDVAAGKKVFKKCSACHAVGEGARNKVGPELNDAFGRTAGTLEGFKYSKAMVAAGTDGLVWTDETVSAYLVDPRGYIKGNRMAFAGLKKEADVANVIAYLKTYSSGVAPAEDAKAKSGEDKAETETGTQTAKAEDAKPAAMAADAPLPDHGVFHLGRKATEAEITAWDIDVRSDGLGLPPGSGTVAEGEPLYADACAVCHGDFGEAIGRWPMLAGGHETLTDERPEKTIGSYWPHLSTAFDYVRRAMPFGDARSLSDDDVYAITAYVLYLNDIVEEEDFELSDKNFASIVLPNQDNFVEDDRLSEPHYAEKREPCMSDCKPGPVEITMRARVLDVTPDSGEDNEGLGVGAVD